MPDTERRMTDAELEDLQRVVAGLTVGGALPGYPWIENEVNVLIANLESERAENARLRERVEAAERVVIELTNVNFKHDPHLWDALHAYDHLTDYYRHWEASRLADERLRSSLTEPDGSDE